MLLFWASQGALLTAETGADSWKSRSSGVSGLLEEEKLSGLHVVQHWVLIQQE